MLDTLKSPNTQGQLEQIFIHVHYSNDTPHALMSTTGGLFRGTLGLSENAILVLYLGVCIPFRLYLALSLSRVQPTTYTTTALLATSMIALALNVRAVRRNASATSPAEVWWSRKANIAISSAFVVLATYMLTIETPTNEHMQVAATMQVFAVLAGFVQFMHK